MTGTDITQKLTTIASHLATVFKRVAKPLWRILSFSLADDTLSPKKNLCVSIEKGGLSFAHGSRFLSQIKIKNFKKYPLEEDRYPQPEGLASSVALAISELGIAKTDLTLNIPKSWAIIKTSEFPSTVKENLPDVVSYELDRLTPFSHEDAVYDFKILKEDNNKLILSVVAAKADLINPYIDALREKGINVTSVTVNLSSIGTLCHYMDKKMDSIFMEIRKDEYEGALFLDGSITEVFTGSFTTGDEKSKINALITEIEPLVDALKKQGKTPQIIVLLNDTSATLRELLKLHFNLPLRILNETDIKIILSGPQKEVSYAAIGGVLESLWPKAKGINLLKKGYYEILKTPFAFTAILILTIIAMCILYMIAPLRIEENKLREIDRQITLRKGEVKKIEALKKEVEELNNEILTIHNFKEKGPMALTILKELTTTLPKNSWLTRVRISESTIVVEGYASSATELLPKLEASKYFQKAEFASPTFRDIRMNADRFNIKTEIEGITKDKGEGIKSEKK